jgi:16S rRNA (uracil1498-N3)-methyltransferase
VASRIFLAEPIAGGGTIELTTSAVRHVHALRLQPGDGLALFDGSADCEWPATIAEIGRNRVVVRVDDAPCVIVRELACDVTLALGMPANDRMDALVEKAGELGAAAIQPLVCARSVLRLSGERAETRRRHWQAVAASASEQCGRARVTALRPIATFADWLQGGELRSFDVAVVLSLEGTAIDAERAFATCLVAARDGGARPRIVVLSGPEGGLADDEEEAAVASGCVRVGLGPRVLRADTAPLACLAWLGIRTLMSGDARR